MSVVKSFDSTTGVVGEIDDSWGGSPLDAYAVSGTSPPVTQEPVRRRASGSVPRLACTPEEAAAALGVSRSKFYADVLPQLRSVRLGRKRIIPIAELELFLTTNASRALP